jgi:diacylglycerol kinase (ATP)
VAAQAPIRLLVNPAAGRGRAVRRLDAARRALETVGPVDVVQTRAAGDEARLATEAARDGVRALVVLGGDGTVSRVAGALVGMCADTPLAVLSAGTGNDFVKSLATPAGDYAAMASLIAAGHTRRVDVGMAGDRPFVNAAGFGFDVAVLERTTRSRWLRGDALYVVSALAELFSFRGIRAHIRAHLGAPPPVDPASEAPSTHLLIVVANGQWFGSTFRIAPAAQLDDGRLDLVVIRDASAWRRARLFAAAPSGGHVHAAEVDARLATALSLQFAQPEACEADGELFRLPTDACEVRLLPGALRVVAERAR